MIENAPVITTDEINELVGQYLARLWANAERDLDAPDCEPEQEASIADEGIEVMTGRLARRQFDGSTLLAAQDALGIHCPPPGTLAHDYALKAVTRAQIEALRIRKAIAYGRYDQAMPNDPIFDDVIGPMYNYEATGITISEALSAWIEERKPGPKTRHEWTTSITRFIEVCGDLLLARITKAHVRDFKDAMAKYPSRPPRKLFGKPVPAMLKAVAKRPDLPRLAPGTVEKQLVGVRSVLSWAVDNGHLDDNPAAGIKVRASRKATRERQPYSTEDLQTIFKGTVHRLGVRPKAGGGEAAYWLPLMALYSGARLEELGQLLISDIKQESGIDFFDINDDEQGKRIKTKGSRRKVPIHPKLVQLGLLDYVANRRKADPEGMLFPDLRPDKFGVMTGLWSKWYGRYCRDLGIEDRSKVFHSFRHTFKDACRAAEVPEDVHDALTGHSGGGVGRSYGNGHSLLVLAKWVGEVHYKNRYQAATKALTLKDAG